MANDTQQDDAETTAQQGNEKQQVQQDAAEFDALKGEQGDSAKNVSRAGHQFRNDAQDLAKEGDAFSQNLTKDWKRDRDAKQNVPDKK